MGSGSAAVGVLVALLGLAIVVTAVRGTYYQVWQSIGHALSFQAIPSEPAGNTTDTTSNGGEPGTGTTQTGTNGGEPVGTVGGTSGGFPGGFL